MPQHRVLPEKRCFAREQRSAMTGAEAMLWRELRAGRLDQSKFKLQVPLGPYIADFVCFEARLIVELDGESHATPDRRLRDAERDAWLAGQGFRVLRFENDALLGNSNVVLDEIRKTLAPSPAFR